jgi:hypothetical protein
MLYSGQYGKSLVSDDFNQMCTDFQVEATIQAFPNPGEMSKAMRLITFQSYSKHTIKIIQSRGKENFIPAKGSCQVMLQADDPLPMLEKVE